MAFTEISLNNILREMDTQTMEERREAIIQLMTLAAHAGGSSALSMLWAVLWASPGHQMLVPYEVEAEFDKVRSQFRKHATEAGAVYEAIMLPENP